MKKTDDELILAAQSGEKEALEEFCCGPEYMMKNGAEACDVTIRCYILAGCIASELDALEEEFTTED